MNALFFLFRASVIIGVLGGRTNGVKGRRVFRGRIGAVASVGGNSDSPPQAGTETEPVKDAVKRSKKPAFVQVGNVWDSVLSKKGESVFGGDFRGTVGNMIDTVAKIVVPSSCIGEVLMTGYVHTPDYGKDEDDYPFMPSCWASGEQNDLACFPEDAQVLTPTGPVPMAELTKGTYIRSESS
eukprot:GHVU01054335.1.p1 GENE.GHVU01054335.1~~GHVU01054335.1.p1  ORF type:complete len:182 (-),score=18.91 GHVU01054335.1:3459-4004(-)